MQLVDLPAGVLRFLKVGLPRGVVEVLIDPIGDLQAMGPLISPLAAGNTSYRTVVEANRLVRRICYLPNTQLRHALKAHECRTAYSIYTNPKI